jgi:putative drug exporter of the RND superfamily
MDYEVFLVSRVREQWVRRRDASPAVADGIALTGRAITAAPWPGSATSSQGFSCVR